MRRALTTPLLKRPEMSRDVSKVIKIEIKLEPSDKITYGKAVSSILK